MKILNISDLHANLEAIEALPKEFDQLWVLGDLVNYGPDPAVAIRYVRQHAGMIVRGNHDHAVGFGEDPHCSARFRKMAEETGRYTRSVLEDDDLHYLRGYPGRPRARSRAPISCSVMRRPGAGWSGVVLAGHTHLPFQRTYAGKTIVNPGSVGQPKHGRAEAFAIWEDGKITVGAVAYDVERAVEKLRRLSIRP